MNKFFTLLALVFLLSKASLAQQIVSFKSLGHDDQAIYGMSGASSVYVRISPLVDIEGSKLVLKLQPSQAVIKEPSFVNVIINDKPVYSARLTPDSIETVTLTLHKQDLSADRFLKVQVKTLLTVTDDICRDLDNPAMWLKVKDFSYLALLRSKTANLSDINISNCFETKRAVVYPADPSLNDLKAVAWAYARLKRSQSKPILLFEAGKVPDSIKNYVQVGVLGSLPEDKKSLIKTSPEAGKGMLYLAQSMTTVTDTVTQRTMQRGKPVDVKSVNTTSVPAEILFVTGSDDDGYKKAIATLANVNILNSSFG